MECIKSVAQETQALDSQTRMDLTFENTPRSFEANASEVDRLLTFDHLIKVAVDGLSSSRTSVLLCIRFSVKESQPLWRLMPTFLLRPMN